MGNQTSTNENQRKRDVNRAVDLALLKQQEIYERQVRIFQAEQEEQNKKKDILIHKAIEALEHKKQVYEIKMKTQEQQAHQSTCRDLYKLNENENKVPDTYIHENRQGKSSIYPTLPSLSIPNQHTNISLVPSSTSNQNRSRNPMMFIEARFPVSPSEPEAAFSSEPENMSKKLRDTSNSVNTNMSNCTTCNKKLGVNIFQCRNKHNSCKNCRVKNIPCGICNQYITSYRNYGLEKRIARMTLHEHTVELVKCPNSQDGCCLHFKPNEIKKHLTECPFNEMQCPTNGLCGWRGKINQLKMHFQENHPECACGVDKEMTININDNSQIMYYIQLGSYNFLLHIKVDVSNCHILTTAQLIGTKMSAAKWSYQFHLFNKKIPKRKYQYVDVCHSNSVTADDKFMTTDCNVIDLTYANTFADNDKLMFKFFLLKY